jgi:hypothetical protein
LFVVAVVALVILSVITAIVAVGGGGAVTTFINVAVVLAGPNGINSFTVVIYAVQ